MSTTGGDNGESVTATAFQTSFTGVASAAQLSADIKEIDLDSQASGGLGTHFAITPATGGTTLTLTESADIDAINLAGKDTLTINGEGAALNGADTYRGLFAYSGPTTIENLTIENAVAKGGAGGGGKAGGGGAGLGGGLFVANNSTGGAAAAHVTLDNVVFQGDSAVGGAGGGGGGGLGGAGGGFNTFPGASGGGGVGSTGGVGLIPGAGGGGSGGTGGGVGGAGASDGSGGGFGGGEGRLGSGIALRRRRLRKPRRRAAAAAGDSAAGAAEFPPTGPSSGRRG